MSLDALEGWLREEDASRLEHLWREADAVRRANVGDEVHLRGLLEISNYCARECGYCGIRHSNKKLARYRMSADEILDGARLAEKYGYGTVVVQGGEDYGIEREWLAGIIRRIKAETKVAVTLSLGERPDEDLRSWREAGADRYLLRFETSDPEVYARIHPALGARPSDRLAILKRLSEMGYETGGGVMVGIPGQTYASLARDITIFRECDFDMVGVGPYIVHPDTPLGRGEWSAPAAPENQVPNTETMTCKVVALTRIVCPEANLPSTTALATVDKNHGREHGLQRGANVVMPNLTPLKYRCLYEIYPAKAGTEVASDAFRSDLVGRLEQMGRVPGKGQGGRRRRDTSTGPAPH
ncbi:MAG TPA: [FeFe] hydrogenase H-cluster radical SAM maturase HydE [Candidatus Hydrogenedentes bacterium]|nr:[FeFe] hydrogenase H-cluster radical SAM maturase HydE [Candidatus Hydrogenedentota bacterium]HPG68314.1 [FeFe] hydrogenase H-cluster radical SAM maturase HydE [Candidatus Hydrogenedentota bacterium]